MSWLGGLALAWDCSPDCGWSAAVLSLYCALPSCSVVSKSSWPHESSIPDSSVHGGSPSKNPGMGCHALLQGTFPTQRSQVSHVVGGFCAIWATGEGVSYCYERHHPITQLLKITMNNFCLHGPLLGLEYLLPRCPAEGTDTFIPVVGWMPWIPPLHRAGWVFSGHDGWLTPHHVTQELKVRSCRAFYD